MKREHAIPIVAEKESSVTGSSVQLPGDADYAAWVRTGFKAAARVGSPFELDSRRNRSAVDKCSAVVGYCNTQDVCMHAVGQAGGRAFTARMLYSNFPHRVTRELKVALVYSSVICTCLRWDVIICLSLAK